MGGDRAIRERVRGSPDTARAVRAIVASWRELTGGPGVRDHAGGAPRRTLIACSGGADSVALVVALASASEDLVVGHVVHDMRTTAEAEKSCDVARALAERMKLRFVVAAIAAKGVRGNYEGNARRLRYAALARMAIAEGCHFVATAHHAEDQLETMLMRLMRGAGPRGLGGLAKRRTLSVGEEPERDPPSSKAVTLIRPMLVVGRSNARRICEVTGSAWHEDETNADTSRVRAAVRHRVLPLIAELAPTAPRAACVTAELLREAMGVVQDEARAVLASSLARPQQSASADQGGASEIRWSRESLRSRPVVVLGEVVSLAALELGVAVGADRRGHRAVSPALDAMRDFSTERRVFVVGGLRISVDAHEVVVATGTLPSVP